jgi:hypothetical protein
VVFADSMPSVVPRSVYPTSVFHGGTYNTLTGRSWQSALRRQPLRNTYPVPFLAPYGGLQQGQFSGRKLAQWGGWGSSGPSGGRRSGGASSGAGSSRGGGGGSSPCRGQGRSGCGYYGNPYGRWGH